MDLHSPLKLSYRMYFGNDPDELMTEFDVYNPVLKRYLDPNFSQDLRNRQEEIDALMRERWWGACSRWELQRAAEDAEQIPKKCTETIQGNDIESNQKPVSALITFPDPAKESDSETLVALDPIFTSNPAITPDEIAGQGNGQLGANRSWREIVLAAKARLTLYEVRSLIGVTRSGLSPVETARNTKKFQRFQSVLERVIDETSRFDGKLYFVYLPGYQDIAATPSGNRDVVLSIVDDLEIPLIDFYPVLNGHDDPLSFFPFRLNGHYTPAGYEWLAEIIIEEVFENRTN